MSHTVNIDTNRRYSLSPYDHPQYQQKELTLLLNLLRTPVFQDTLNVKCQGRFFEKYKSMQVLLDSNGILHLGNEPEILNEMVRMSKGVSSLGTAYGHGNIGSTAAAASIFPLKINNDHAKKEKLANTTTNFPVVEDGHGQNKNFYKRTSFTLDKFSKNNKRQSMLVVQSISKHSKYHVIDALPVYKLHGKKILSVIVDLHASEMFPTTNRVTSGHRQRFSFDSQDSKCLSGYEATSCLYGPQSRASLEYAPHLHASVLQLLREEEQHKRMNKSYSEVDENIHEEDKEMDKVNNNNDIDDNGQLDMQTQTYECPSAEYPAMKGLFGEILEIYESPCAVNQSNRISTSVKSVYYDSRYRLLNFSHKSSRPLNNLGYAIHAAVLLRRGKRQLASANKKNEVVLSSQVTNGNLTTTNKNEPSNASYYLTSSSQHKDEKTNAQINNKIKHHSKDQYSLLKLTNQHDSKSNDKNELSSQQLQIIHNLQEEIKSMELKLMSMYSAEEMHDLVEEYEKKLTIENEKVKILESKLNEQLDQTQSLRISILDLQKTAEPALGDYQMLSMKYEDAIRKLKEMETAYHTLHALYEKEAKAHKRLSLENALKITKDEEQYHSLQRRAKSSAYEHMQEQYSLHSLSMKRSRSLLVPSSTNNLLIKNVSID